MQQIKPWDFCWIPRQSMVAAIDHDIVFESMLNFLKEDLHQYKYCTQLVFKNRVFKHVHVLNIRLKLSLLLPQSGPPLQKEICAL